MDNLMSEAVPNWGSMWREGKFECISTSDAEVNEKRDGTLHDAYLGFMPLSECNPLHLRGLHSLKKANLWNCIRTTVQVR